MNHKDKNAVEVVDSWFNLVPSEQFSSDEMYAAIAAEVEAQEFPGLTVSRVELHEGGLLSDKREYLRMQRERIIVDFCAAPVGVNYFFSYRHYILPPVIKIWEMVAFSGFIGFFAYALTRIGGLVMGLSILALALLFIFWLMKGAVGRGMRDLDMQFLTLPILGPIYERYFRADSFYRQDLRVAYNSIVGGIAKQVMEAAIAAKGAVLVERYANDPVLYGLRRVGERRMPESARGTPREVEA